MAGGVDGLTSVLLLVISVVLLPVALLTLGRWYAEWRHAVEADRLLLTWWELHRPDNGA